MSHDVSTQTKPNQVSLLNGRVNGKNEPVASTVHSTRNYSLFRFSPANRPINGKHLEKLHDAIEGKNLLEKYPIIVTPEMIVIDGQHRLKAAEALRLPVFYVVAENMSIADISKINDVTLKWTAQDYLHYWCEMGNEDYKQIAAFTKRWREVSLNYMLRFLSTEGGRGGGASNWDSFRAGRSKTVGLANAEKLLTVARSFEPCLHKRWKHDKFMGAVNWLLRTPGYSHETMMKRMEYQSTKLVPCVSIGDYLVLLTEIYNYRTRPENQLDFAAHHRMATSRKSRKA